MIDLLKDLMKLLGDISVLSKLDKTIDSIKIIYYIIKKNEEKTTEMGEEAILKFVDKVDMIINPKEHALGKYEEIKEKIQEIKQKLITG
jgi:hypothetical protein